jgi:hypothetical protein
VEAAAVVEVFKVIKCGGAGLGLGLEDAVFG